MAAAAVDPVHGEELLPAPFRVVRRRQETHDTWTLELEPAGPAPGADVGPFAPGQFSMLYAFGAGEVPISVSGELTAGSGLVHTIRAVGAVTEALCSTPEGGVVGVRGPYGTTWPIEEAAGRDVVVVAGGIGLAPLRPAIYELLTNRDRYGQVSVLYGGRSPEELLFVEELETWRSRLDVDVDVTVDSAERSWRGRVGVVTNLIGRATFDPENTLAMMVGPEVMMRFAAEALGKRGLGDDAIWLALERSMKCGVGHCGHCQLGPFLVCRDGSVVRRDVVGPYMRVREL